VNGQLQLIYDRRLMDVKFEEFHRENPLVYRALLRFARQVQAAGFDHYSINSLFERVRWHMNIETHAHDGFKLNNNHRAYYARMLNQEPGLEDFFRTRELRAA